MTPRLSVSTPPPRLWAVTPPDGAPAAACVDAWGTDEIGLWLRTPGAAPAAILERCAAVVAKARARGVPIMIGCDASAVARWDGIAGVVLRGDPSRAALQHARNVLGPTAWIGRSTHAASADHDLCTWTVLGPVFAPHTPKPQPSVPLGTATLARVAADPAARIVAIGGVDVHTAPACLAAGAWGLAGIRSFFGEPNQVAQDVAVLRAQLQTAKHGPTTT